jgi:membrane protease YdiL (CAAX protease family)
MRWIISLVALVVGAAVVRVWAQLGQRRPLFRRLLLGAIALLGLLACVAGAALWAGIGSQFVQNQRSMALAFAGGGLGLLLPLMPWVRRVLAWVTPIDPASVLDTVGLSAAFAFLGLSVGITTALSPDTTLQPVTLSELVAQSAAFVVVAFVLVGLGIERGWHEAIERLGFRPLSLRGVGNALALIALLFVASGLAGALTQALQPEVTQQVGQRMVELTGPVSSLPGAVVLGISAGVGEEILFRGAIQPRFGIWLTSLLFTMAHVQYAFSFLLLGVFALSLILGWERKRYGTLACILTHAGYDLIAVLLQSVVR